LNFDTSAGVRGSNLALNGNFRRKNFGISLGGFGRSEYNVNGKFESTQITYNKGIATTNVQTAETRREGIFGNYQLGFDWDINKYKSITSNVRFGLRNGNNWQDGLKQIRDAKLVNTRNTNSLDESANVDINVDYTKTFEKPQKEFSILSMYSRNNRTNDFYNLIMNPNSTMSQIMSSIKNANNSYNEEATIQMDYQTPINKMSMIEFGAKAITRNVTSDYKSYTAGADGIYGLVNSATLPSNVFDYNQNIWGTYGSYMLTT
jgi:hypothetical protein